MDGQQLSLTELQALIKEAMEGAFPESYWVRAEISEMTVNRSGHCYLDLVETDSGGNTVTARIRATIWSYTFRMLKPYFESITGQLFSEGIKVLLNVKIEYHEVYGISLNVRDIDPTYTLGDMARQRREIIRKLEEEGVLEMNKELEMPLVPQKIAIISSPTAAGLQDFLDQLHNNTQKIKFYTRLFPATMQGKEAPASMMEALDRIYAHEEFFDMVAIIRGGGSQVDLAAFDNYELAYHVTQFPLPVITGIGHDKDDSVVDLVAHTRLKTPTAVAEFLISTVTEFVSYLKELEQQFVVSVQDKLEENQERINSLLTRFSNEVRLKMKEEQQFLEIAGIKLKSGVESYFQEKQNNFKTLAASLKSGTTLFVRHQHGLLDRSVEKTRFETKTLFREKAAFLKAAQHELNYKTEDILKFENQKLKNLGETLRLVDPQEVLKRGFSITLKNGKVVKSVNQVAPGDQLETLLNDGTIVSNVETTKS